MPANRKNQIIFIMGVSGSGKSTISSLLSKTLNIPFFDGDDFHPKFNKDKMASGKALNDEDRKGWLLKLNQVAKEHVDTGCIIACSALKKKYRTLLGTGIEHTVKWFFLSGTFEEILNRMNQRKEHFMPSSLLQSQFDTLEFPKSAIALNINNTPETIVEKITQELNKNEFGLIGLGVMGKSLCRNLAKNNFPISMYNRHVAGKEENIALHFKKKYPELKKSEAFDQLDEFVSSLARPRKIILMVNAGDAVDYVISNLIPLLDNGDVIIDGGNSHYKNTQDRYELLKKKDLYFLGMGVSGGEEGALNGPSMMPGGDLEAYKIVKHHLEAIAAKDKNGLPCCEFLGNGGAGHFIKMVHNGVEYAEMQLLAEVYSILRLGMQKQPDEIAAILKNWTETSLNSYLLEITVKILQKKENGSWLIDIILDKAGNKGTGNWTTVAAAQLGVPIDMLTSSLFSRYISSFKNIRERAAAIYQVERKVLEINIDDLKEGYHLSRIINHQQGIHLLNEASNTYNWNLNLSEIARVWTEGCIIRSDFMQQLITILQTENQILLNKGIAAYIKSTHPLLAKVVSKAIQANLAIPCFSSAINYLNSYTEEHSNANMIQAQRDFFGAHTYQKKNDISNQFYHTNWTSN